VESTQHLGFSLLDTSRLYRRRFQERSRDLALDLIQCRALVTLADNEGVTQRRLAQLIMIDPAPLGRNLDRLERRGWMMRHPRPGDRRARSLAITSKAREHLPLIRRLFQESDVAALQSLSRDERQLLTEALRRVLANLRAHQSEMNAATLLQGRAA
jgi:MarR family transcriptional regulator, transcriptional regulator for hemolysin